MHCRPIMQFFVVALGRFSCGASRWFCKYFFIRDYALWPFCLLKLKLKLTAITITGLAPSSILFWAKQGN
ncbi:hypothetical protein VNO78_15596 [Psophocarpus tetragonolobus]|uniref:Uncharacterized protein n=1 Tax=Psophocarpus tetragonolobus TaxID=3891 RepID=A0AAN9XJX2_PSOTE